MESRTKRAHTSDEFLEDDHELRALAELISAMPDEEPPHGLRETVMSRIEVRREGTLLRRLKSWTFRPVTLRFTPAGLAPVMALVFVALFLFPRLFSPEQETALQEKVVPIVFTISLENASSVAVVGTFNRWNPAGYELKRNDGAWVLETSLPEGRHEYAFLIDGVTIMTDPGGAFTADDGFGNRNSVLILGTHDLTA
jgi:hypothetical protein